MALGCQQFFGGVVGAAEGGRQGPGEYHFLQVEAAGAGLLAPGVRQAGKVVPALDAVLQVEAAESMANQH